MFLVLFFVFIASLFLVYALFLLTSRKSDARRKLLNDRLAEAIRSSAHSTDVDVQLAREELLSEIPWLNRSLLKISVTSRLKKMIDQADLQVTVMRLVLFSLTAAALGFLAASMVTVSVPLKILFALLAGVFPFLHVMNKRKKRLKKFLQLLPDALDLMSRGLSAGHAFTESLQMVATEMPEPIAAEFRKTYDEQNLGLSLKLALENMVQRVPLLDLRMCVTAIMIQRETGGNLSAWLLCGLPVFMAVYMTLMNPQYMEVMWRDPRGHNLLFIAAVMQILGMLMVQRIMRIKI
jgi:tight adherence protein B